MVFHENRLLADDSHVISCLIFCQILGKMSKNLSSAAVVIGALRVKVFNIRFSMAVLNVLSLAYYLCNHNQNISKY